MTQSIWSVHGRAHPTKIKEIECLPALTVFHLVPAIPSRIKMPLFLFKQASFVKVFFVAFVGMAGVSKQFGQNTPCCQGWESRRSADKKGHFWKESNSGFSGEGKEMPQGAHETDDASKMLYIAVYYDKIPSFRRE